MRYIRTKDGIKTTATATHELIKDIVDEGYSKTLKKGTPVRVGDKWTNYYGCFVDLIDENDHHYSVRHSLVKEVIRELPQADKLPELCDAFVIVANDGQKYTYYSYDGCVLAMMMCEEEKIEIESYGAIWTIGEDGEPILKSVAKMNEKGELELL